MPKKKRSNGGISLPGVPEHVATAPVMRKKRVSRNGIGRFTLDMLAAWAPEMLANYFCQLWKKAKEGDMEALEDVAEIYGLISRRGAAPMVNVNVGGQMAVSGAQGFDSLIRQIHAARSEVQASATAAAEIPPPSQQLEPHPEED